MPLGEAGESPHKLVKPALLTGSYFFKCFCPASHIDLLFIFEYKYIIESNALKQVYYY
jgi:hypothetical protein